MTTKYIAIVENEYGDEAHAEGDTLEEVYRNLKLACEVFDEENARFFEATPIEVEFKPVKKTEPVKVNSKGKLPVWVSH